jgi:hypothetical protein
MRRELKLFKWPKRQREWRRISLKRSGI